MYWRNEPRLAELAPRHGALFSEALQRAQRAIDQLWHRPPHRPHLIHGDLCPSNLMVNGDEVTVPIRGVRLAPSANVFP